MDFNKLKATIPSSRWESLTYQQRFAYLKWFIPFTWDERYGYAIRDLKEFLNNN